MKIIFLDFDGVLNSLQSFKYWDKKRNQQDWEKDLRDAQVSLLEYMADEFCPICVNNVEELIIRTPGVKIVVSSSWRVGRTIEDLKQILKFSPTIGDAIIDVTESLHSKRGNEIQKWLDEHPEVTDYVILDDDSDMLDSQQKNFVKTAFMHGFQYGDMLWALRVLGEGNQT